MGRLEYTSCWFFCRERISAVALEQGVGYVRVRAVSS